MGLLADFAKILEQDLSDHRAQTPEAGAITPELEHSHMTPQDQTILVSIFNDIYAKIETLSSAVASLGTTEISTEQLSSAVSTALGALPAFDPSGITGYTPAASTTTTTSGTAQSSADTSGTVASVSDSAQATIQPPPPPSGSAYTS